MLILAPDPDVCSSVCPQDVPGVGLVPAPLEALGLSEKAAEALIKAGAALIIIDQTEEKEGN